MQKQNMSRTFVALFLLLLVQTLSLADNETMSAREENKQRASKAYEENLEKYKGNPDALVLPGLVADREERRIRILAEATEVSGTDPIEFFLIWENSGHDYEALAVSFAKPSDIHEALLFIGMESGSAVDTEKLRFWPKGERVLMTFASLDSEGVTAPSRAERLIADDRTGNPLPLSGFVFVGSSFLEPGRSSKEKVYSADIHGPNSIASCYNEPTTVLDVPHKAAQGEVYNHQFPIPDLLFSKHSLLDVVIEPEYMNGRKRVLDLLLTATPKNGPEPASNKLGEIAFDMFAMKESGGGLLLDGGGFDGVLQTLGSLREKGHDPFLTIRLHTNMTLAAVSELAGALSSLDTDNGARIEPPLAGHLYYKAYLPDGKFRDRNKRIAQPWELHLSAQDGEISGELTHIEELWQDDRIEPELKINNYKIRAPSELRKELDRLGPGLPVILVFAPPTLLHGRLMDFLKPVLPTHDTIWVFTE